jgi:hypothetical protein
MNTVNIPSLKGMSLSLNSIKVPSYMKLENMNSVEYLTIAIFILYLIFPIYPPNFLSYWIDSSLGYVGIFIICVVLFLYSHPLLAVLFIFVAFEMLRRSSDITTRIPMLKYTPSEKKRASEMKEMNPPRNVSLEEEIVSQMSPVGRSDPIVYQSSGFQPVAEKVGTASKYM